MVPESLPERARKASWGSPITWEQADPFMVREGRRGERAERGGGGLKRWGNTDRRLEEGRWKKGGREESWRC